MYVVGDASILKAAGKGHTVKVAVEGNIGSGKTTFLEGCQQFVDTTVLIEPVTIWRDLQGQNLLELMYKEPKRWSLAFQTYVQLTMMQLHLAPVQTPVKLMERSLHSARYVFIENLYRSGHMTSLELSILDQWFGWINENVAVGLDMIIYLRTRPEVAMARIQKRKRPEEDQLPFDWLCQVHNLHEDWLLGRSKFPLPPKVLSKIGNTLRMCGMAKASEECRRRIVAGLGAQIPAKTCRRYGCNYSPQSSSAGATVAMDPRFGAKFLVLILSFVASVFFLFYYYFFYSIVVKRVSD
ncbi:deoxynucleoside kinase isoform X2 [Dermacentor albipictus]|uniref:deoxynucleoside kinase isoform X2 n=1 Tax=Dermacentor albipictus TaxID=60249 RepID=UPI0038FCB67C